ncbi:Wzz/FepE/Etk N-terminal domain-containing protein [Roseicella aerolata]|uniref:Polysaccharide chain length determinant N-terminal domain-containing protein n=1 Tax=Roseicella aerolata TaxID=2883479 RepID=A0A9X1I9B2_9PROT|nr:Wzz/FepE/Etk N-terminal domain-containing protein [Roseicella aerolata]MCB4820594.1 hypothetical protein [Roseicella aerolata]
MPLDQLLRGVWERRWRVALLSLLLFALGAGVLFQLPRRYVAQAVVAPAETTGIATSTLLSPVPLMAGGLLDDRSSGNFAIYLDALRSPEAAAMLARETGLLGHLTALRGAGPTGWVRRTLGLRLEADLDDAMAWLARSLAATQNIATVTVTLTLAHRDREAALDALRRLHALAEAKVRSDLAELARRRIAVIEARLAVERDVFLRNALYELLGQQQRGALVVAADEAVAARLVSAPMVELRPSLPNRPLLLVLLAIAAPLAAFAGVAALVLLRLAGRERREAAPALPLSHAMRMGAD